MLHQAALQHKSCAIRADRPQGLSQIRTTCTSQPRALGRAATTLSKVLLHDGCGQLGRRPGEVEVKACSLGGDDAE